MSLLPFWRFFQGVFYAAGHHESGSMSADVCRYGSAFCDNPFMVLVGAGVAAAWGALSASVKTTVLPFRAQEPNSGCDVYPVEPSDFGERPTDAY